MNVGLGIISVQVEAHAYAAKPCFAGHTLPPQLAQDWKPGPVLLGVETKKGSAGNGRGNLPKKRYRGIYLISGSSYGNGCYELSE
jgi:hypothetical protein